MPRYLEEHAILQDEDDICDAIPTIVVCSGDLIEQVFISKNLEICADSL